VAPTSTRLDLPTGAVFAAKGLLLRESDEIWTIDRVGAGAVHLTLGSRRRDIELGDLVTTEGGLSGPIVLIPNGGPSEADIVLADRLRTVLVDFVGEAARSENEEVIYVLVAERPVRPDEVHALFLSVASKFDDVARALANVIRIGPSSLPVPTPSFRLEMLEPSEDAGWIEVLWPTSLRRAWIELGLTLDDAIRAVRHATSDEQVRGWLPALRVSSDRRAELARLMAVSPPEVTVVTGAAGARRDGTADPEVSVTAGVDVCAPISADSDADNVERMEWFRHFEDAAIAERWRGAGFVRPATATAWANDGFDPLLAWQWYELDVRGPEVARKWIDHGWTAERAKPWLDAAFSDPVVAADWLDAGLDPSTSSAWLEVGVSDPRRARRAESAGAVPADAREFAVRRVATEVAYAWLRSGPGGVPELWSDRIAWAGAAGRPDEARKWLSIGVEVPDCLAAVRSGADLGRVRNWVAHDLTVPEVLDVINLGFGHEELIEWVDRDWSLESLLRWRQEGFGPELADRWLGSGFDSEIDAGRWMRSGYRPEEAVQWYRAGFVYPLSAETWRAHHVAPEVAFALHCDGEREPKAALSVIDCLGAELLCRLLDLGVRLEEQRQLMGDPRLKRRSKRLTRLLEDARVLPALRAFKIPVANWPSWILATKGDVSVAAAWFSAGVTADQLCLAVEQLQLDPARLGEWTSLGWTALDMLEHRAEDRNTPPERPRPHKAVSASSARPRSASPTSSSPATGRKLQGRKRRVAWEEGASNWLRAAHLSRPVAAPLLDELFELGLGWIQFDDVIFPFEHDDEDYDEVLARAENVAQRLKKAPNWPVMFESDDFTIVLLVTRDVVIAWVGHGTDGLLLRIDPVTFDVRTRRSNPGWKYAASLAISWYVDVCIVLPGRAPSSTRRASSPAVSLAATRMVCYLPRPGFGSHRLRVANGSHNPPRAHRVKGFVRTFENGQAPTAWARKHAPANRVRQLLPNQTWVQSHVRGVVAERERLLNHLSKYSMLAETAGFVMRHSTASSSPSVATATK